MSEHYRIRLIAPSGYCQNQAAAQRGADYLINAGHQLENREVIERRFQRFAGTDSQRLADINALADCTELPDIVLAVRGGYGASRLLADIHYSALGSRLNGQPVALCGHSDFTAIQLALLAECGLVTFSAPMLSGNFGAEPLSEFTLTHFRELLAQPLYTLHWSADTGPSHALSVKGQLWGGNLAMLTSLVGTRWMPDINDGILVIEDVNEHPFRIERMLLQLFYAGILQRQHAVIVGSFSGVTASDYDQGYHFSTVWQMLSELSGVPFISGLPFGHEQETVTLPIGAQAELEYHQGNASLTLSGYPTLVGRGSQE